MKPSKLERTTSNRISRARAMSIATGITAVAVLGALLTSAALAQRGPAPMSEERLQAPIGHRQPRVQDLPAGVARDEGARTPGQKAFDKELEICRAC